MAHISFSLNEIFSKAWAKFQEKPLIFILTFVAFFLLIFICGLLIGGLNWLVVQIFGYSDFGGFIMVLINLCYGLLLFKLALGVQKMFMNAAKGVEYGYSDFFSVGWLTMFKIIGASIITGLMIVVGLYMLILPGLYAMIRLWMVPFLLLDDPELGILEAVDKSLKLTDGNELNLIIFQLFTIAVNIIGFMALGIGCFISIPVALLMKTFLQYDLLGKSGE